MDRYGTPGAQIVGGRGDLPAVSHPILSLSSPLVAAFWVAGEPLARWVRP